MSDDMTPEMVLGLPMGQNDAEAATIRDYLKALLRELWAEGESFSGKRPFGNSGWEYDLYKPLVTAEVVTGRLDGDGYVAEVDKRAADGLIHDAINAL